MLKGPQAVCHRVERLAVEQMTVKPSARDGIAKLGRTRNARRGLRPPPLGQMARSSGEPATKELPPRRGGCVGTTMRICTAKIVQHHLDAFWYEGASDDPHPPTNTAWLGRRRQALGRS
jgi:hypothetical protein